MIHDGSSPRGHVAIAAFEPVGAVVQTMADPRGATLTCAAGSRIRIVFPNARMVRITAACEDPAAPTLADEVCLVTGGVPEPSRMERAGNKLILSSASTRVEVDLADLTVDIFRADGTPARKGLRFLRAARTLLMAWPLAEEEGIFGLGENTIMNKNGQISKGLNKRGRVEDIWVIHSYWHCDKPIPFLLSTGGYGLYLHCSFRSVFDLGASRKDEARCFVDHDRADIVVFTAPRFPGMVRDYTLLTGRSPLPPRWAFGFWQSTTQRTTQQDLIDKVAEFEKRDIPLDVLAIDGWWMDHNECWEWRPDFYPKPAELVKHLTAADIKLSLWTAPFIRAGSRLHREGAADGHLMTNADGVPAPINCWCGKGMFLPDLAVPEARDWFGRQFHPLIAGGASVIKTPRGPADLCPRRLPDSGGAFHPQGLLAPARVYAARLRRRRGQARILRGRRRDARLPPRLLRAHSAAADR